MDRADQLPAAEARVMGYVWLILLGAAAMAVMAWRGLPRRLWSFAGAALMLGAAGYAWQGRPMLAGTPVAAVSTPGAVDPALVALREELLGRFTQDTAYIIAADAMTRAGDARAAAQVTLGGLRKLPRSFILWTWLGVTTAASDGDQMSPAALLAFGRAAQLAPEHPGPPFFLGLTYLRAGDAVKARAAWRRAVALSPAGTHYRREIAMRLALLEMVMGRAGGR